MYWRGARGWKEKRSKKNEEMLIATLRYILSRTYDAAAHICKAFRSLTQYILKKRKLPLCETNVCALNKVYTYGRRKW